MCVCVCVYACFVATLHFLTYSKRERKKACMCLEDITLEHAGDASFRPSSERADLTE